MRNRTRFAATALAGLLTGVLVAGCSSSTSPDDAETATYPGRVSPDSVLLRFRLAHENRDVEPYADCLAEDFMFFLSVADCAADPSLPDSWDRSTEVDIAEAMFDAAGMIDSVFLSMTTLSAVENPGPDPTDPADDLWEYQEEVDLELVADDGSRYFAAGPVEFVFQRDADARDGDDPLWEIVEWRDLGATCPDSCGVIYSWTAIKLMVAEDDTT